MKFICLGYFDENKFAELPPEAAQKMMADCFRAMIRILTLTVNGKRQTSASYYDIPLQKHLKKGSTTASP